DGFLQQLSSAQEDLDESNDRFTNLMQERIAHIQTIVQRRGQHHGVNGEAVDHLVADTLGDSVHLLSGNGYTLLGDASLPGDGSWRLPTNRRKRDIKDMLRPIYIVAAALGIISYRTATIYSNSLEDV
ncbi:unnamed protein product, partial [Meganyctiphanes norvegica]